MNLTRNNNNITYRMDNLPKLSSNQFRWNNQIGYTGSIIERPVSVSLGIYRHYGIIYGFDESGVLLVIENNLNGIECVTFDDFMAGNTKFYIKHLITDTSKIPIILRRMRNRSLIPYNARYNNCEHPVYHAVFGIAKSFQAEISEQIANVILSLIEDSIRKSKDRNKLMNLKALDDIRKTLNLNNILS